MRFIFAILALLACGSAHAGFFVGNGGEGIEIDGKLYMLDLYTVGAHAHPYVGTRIDPHLPALPPNLLPSDLPRDLLQRKLTDINAAAPGLGDYLVAVIESYHWLVLASGMQPVTPDPQDPIIGLPDSQRIPLATRLQMNIYIDGSQWPRLDDNGKVALILHEAIYSLVKPVDDGSGNMRQPAYIVRAINGNFFTADYFTFNPSTNYSRLKPVLEIPEQMQGVTYIRHPLTWGVNIWDKVSRIQLSGQNKKGLEQFVSDVCAPVERKRGPIYYSIASWLDRKPFVLNFLNYPVTSDDGRRLQQYVQILAQVPSRLEKDYLRDPQECRALLEGLMGEALAEVGN